jgi:hypothetical protein
MLVLNATVDFIAHNALQWDTHEKCNVATT